MIFIANYGSDETTFKQSKFKKWHDQTHLEVTPQHEPLKHQQVPKQRGHMIREHNCEQDGEIPPAIKKEDTKLKKDCLLVYSFYIYIIDNKFFKKDLPLQEFQLGKQQKIAAHQRKILQQYSCQLQLIPYLESDIL